MCRFCDGLPQGSTGRNAKTTRDATRVSSCGVSHKIRAAEEQQLLAALTRHLAQVALFKVNTGARAIGPYPIAHAILVTPPIPASVSQH